MKFARFRFLLPVLALALPGVLLSLRPGRGQDWLETAVRLWFASRSQSFPPSPPTSDW